MENTSLSPATCLWHSFLLSRSHCFAPSPLSLSLFPSIFFSLCAPLRIFHTDEWTACWRTHTETEVDISSFNREQERRTKADERSKKDKKGRRRIGESRQRAVGGEKEKKKREPVPPKWLLSFFKLVISVITGKNIAEAIRGDGDSLSLSPFLLLSVTSSLIISTVLPLMSFFKDGSICFGASQAQKWAHTSLTNYFPLLLISISGNFSLVWQHERVISFCWMLPGRINYCILLDYGIKYI